MREGITVQEASELKKELQVNICKLVNEFEGATGLNVTDVDIYPSATMAGPRTFNVSVVLGVH